MLPHECKKHTTLVVRNCRFDITINYKLKNNAYTYQRLNEGEAERQQRRAERRQLRTERQAQMQKVLAKAGAEWQQRRAERRQQSQAKEEAERQQCQAVKR